MQSRIVSGQGLLNEASSAVTTLQSSVNSTSPAAGLLNTVLDALSGASSSGGSASNSLASLESSSDLPSRRHSV